MIKLLAQILAVVVLATACNGDGADDETQPRSTPDATTCADASIDAGTPEDPRAIAGELSLGERSVALEEVAELDEPVGIAFRCGDDAVYVIEAAGVVKAISGDNEPEPVLDITDLVSSEGREQGLLGIAFHPDGERLYLYFTGLDNVIQLVEYRFSGGRADRASARRLLEIPFPSPVHQAGHLTFGPDGLLYVAIGDGGPDERGEAQNLDNLFGSILRIDPTPSDDAPYTIPDDNPFLERDDARGEVWAFGFRNPWRFSFDAANGDLWVGDVGDLHWEEVTRVPFDDAPGTNFGWPLFEGSHPHFRPEADMPDDHLLPLYDYAHGGAGCAVIGGHVYRGSEIPFLRGAYIFGDFCAQDIRALVLEGEAVVAEVALTSVEGSATAFGEDSSGTLYLATRGPGQLLRLVPAD